MPPLDYDACRSLLEQNFKIAERRQLTDGDATDEGNEIKIALDAIFASRTQAYREVLLGCLVAKLQDRSVDITLPYMGLGDHAYNGRTLDEKAVNPFLRDKKVPCSKGPFLNVFRRMVRFDEATRRGVRDKDAFDAFLFLVRAAGRARHSREVVPLLQHLLRRFVRLRESTEIAVLRLRRISLDQIGELVSFLLASSSGGRFPVFLAASCFRAIRDSLDLDWEIEEQGINVSDRASGAGGDITITRGGAVVLAAEVTERAVSRDRVVATFDTKIAPQSIEDYLFLVKDAGQARDVMEQTRNYFAQGHEINIFELRNWIVTVLSLCGRRGRDAFLSHMVALVERDDTPAGLKVSWNKAVSRVTSAGQ